MTKRCVFDEFLRDFEPKREEIFYTKEYQKNILAQEMESEEGREANVMPKNIASLRVLEKNGFENEGIAKYYLNINGVWEDHIHMVKINYSMH